ncbi:M12 family metallo-peptidase [Fluoribacter gormanii]|uniref:reprolysin-like metallopeptidase n=1 Tax=Fluoribacter gormanii TaxID=464 RepID=UPI0010417891|nr:zinc-dependent metalloprotease family protein [Fluoribacter gormanii]MCW8469572.1 M12 family metallo-peptidase [Fluoribacter gormanii]
MTRTLFSSALILFCSIASAQDQMIEDFFKDVNPSAISTKKENNIQASHFRIVEIDLSQLYAELENVPHRDELKSGAASQIALPLPDGTTKLYQVVENSTLHPELSAKFPTIKTYDAYGVTDPGEFVKLDLTPQGFHAMILRPGQSPVFIDPLRKGSTQYYIIYNKKDFITSKRLKCGVQSQNQFATSPVSSKHFARFNSCQLKKYRLAMAATAEYTQFQGGTVNDALGAEATTINRVNGVYEIDMAITMQIIANNNLIIYTDPNNQPYTHGVPEQMINENQQNVNQVIGAANYDIGHVVDSAGSGLAGLACVCNDGRKARGVTGQAKPVGDPFDIDYVAHEMGHQFGANHVQNNSCQRNGPTAVEPGSGSTIMGYAGICAPNVQKNSDAYFNGISLQEMGNFVSNPSHTCPVTTDIPDAPVISSTNGGAIIPAQTPFALTASATKNGGTEVLTYTWEQMNNEVSPQPPVSSATVGPSFRSFSPQPTGTRFFPNLNALSNGGPFTWEVIPSVSRIMKFRVSVRRNTPGGSCNAYTDTTITTTSNAGPFIVTSPTSKGISWTGLSPQTITWDVANTNFSPVNAKNVNILLSIDGGKTFPYTLLSNITNNGQEQICAPNLNTTTARIMVQASNGTFFNISKNNFSIIAVPTKAPVLTAAERDPMSTHKAFVLYADCIPVSNNVYTVNGLPGATVKLDIKNHRFVIENILTPKRVPNVTITATNESHISQTSNPITIPSIL